MALKRFKTQTRLWSWISLVLFVVPWFVPFGDLKGSGYLPVTCWWVLFAYPGHLVETLAFIGYFILLFGIPAICIGWVLQCVIVMIKSAKRRKTEMQDDIPLAPN
jgi:hypothetical protein